MLTKY